MFASSFYRRLNILFAIKLSNYMLKEGKAQILVSSEWMEVKAL